MVKNKNIVKGKRKDESVEKTIKKGSKEAYRCSLVRLCDLSKELHEIGLANKPEHMKLLRECPFWPFYEPYHEKAMKKNDLGKRINACKMMLNTYSCITVKGKDKHCFRFVRKKSMNLESTPAQLAVILGIQRLEEKTLVTNVEMEEEINNFCMKYFDGKRKMDKRLILDGLMEAARDETQAKDFVRLLVLFFLVQIFFVHKGGQNLAANYLDLVFQMNEVSWPDLIHEHLMKSVNEAKQCNIIENASGFTVYPLLWFAEMTHIVKKKDPTAGKSYPRFTRWNIDEVCQQIQIKLDQFDNEIIEKMNTGFGAGSFLDQYDQHEKNLTERIKGTTNVREHLMETSVADVAEERPSHETVRVDRSVKNESYMVKYQFVRKLVDKLAAGNRISKEEEAILKRYDDEVEEEKSKETCDQFGVEEEQVQQKPSAGAFYNRKRRRVSEGLTENVDEFIEDVGMAQNVNEDIDNLLNSEFLKVDKEAEMQVQNDVQELTPNTIEDIKMVEKVETEHMKRSSSSKTDSASEKTYYYSAVKMAEDVVLLEEEGEVPSFNLGLTPTDKEEEEEDDGQELTPEQVMSNMITRMKKNRRKMQKPITLKDYTPGQPKKRTKSLAVKNRGLHKLEPLILHDKLDILKVLKQSQRETINDFFKDNYLNSIAWENTDLALVISGEMVSDLIRGKDISGNIIEFYTLKLQKCMLKHEEKENGDPKYQNAVFLSTLAFTLHKMGKKCSNAIENFINKMDWSVRFVFVPLLTKLDEGASHWTLLVFDGEEGHFSHYNSLKSTESKCHEDANSMKERLVCAFKQHLVNNKIEPSSQSTYEMLTPECHQQKENNCALHVCYYMKKLMKDSIESAGEDIAPKINNMRAKLAFKIITAEN